MRPSRAAQITRHFGQRSAWWDRIYEQTSLEARILRRRQQVALTWVEQLSLAKGSQVLEIGSGAGLTAVQLAKRGHVVCALDRSPAMARLTPEHALSSGVGQAVTPLIGNVHRLMFPDGAFGLVIALGVLSWLEDPNAAIDEMARVTQPGGHVLVTSLNSLDVGDLLVRSQDRSPDCVFVDVQAEMDGGKIRDTGYGRLLPYGGSARSVWVIHADADRSRPFQAD